MILTKGDKKGIGLGRVGGASERRPSRKEIKEPSEKTYRNPEKKC